MKYFIDTEFHEYKRKPLFGRATDTIELISLGITCLDGREYYAVCSDFDIKAAWKNDWLREHVLLSIYLDLVNGDTRNYIKFDYQGMRHALAMYGKSRKQIAGEVKSFVYSGQFKEAATSTSSDGYPKDIQFIGYYSDYDWVVFCWLFGRMIDLPKGFPMYCYDLKQKVDDLANKFNDHAGHYVGIDAIKNDENYPKQVNEHHALSDAKWNMELYKFLQGCKY